MLKLVVSGLEGGVRSLVALVSLPLQWRRRSCSGWAINLCQSVRVTCLRVRRKSTDLQFSVVVPLGSEVFLWLQFVDRYSVRSLCVLGSRARTQCCCVTRLHVSCLSVFDLSTQILVRAVLKGLTPSFFAAEISH